jgi:uncharacterized protein (UPF0548 family)
MTTPRALFGHEDPAAALAELRGLSRNYDPAEVAAPEWNFDRHVAFLGSEAPGPPEPDGLWERARAAIEGYEFTPPHLIRAVYDCAEPLLGRNLLLEGRFNGLRFHLPLRITEVVNTDDGEQRCWGWAYETLEHHLERGKVTYTVVKHMDTGNVHFHADVYSQHAPTLGPVLRLGWAVFGRRTQLRFYRLIGARLRAIATGKQPRAVPYRSGSLVFVPAGSGPTVLDRLLTPRFRHPARQ